MGGAKYVNEAWATGRVADIAVVQDLLQLVITGAGSIYNTQVYYHTLTTPVLSLTDTSSYNVYISYTVDTDGILREYSGQVPNLSTNVTTIGHGYWQVGYSHSYITNASMIPCIIHTLIIGSKTAGIIAIAGNTQIVRYSTYSYKSSPAVSSMVYLCTETTDGKKAYSYNVPYNDSIPPFYCSSMLRLIGPIGTEPPVSAYTYNLPTRSVDFAAECRFSLCGETYSVYGSQYTSMCCAKHVAPGLQYIYILLYRCQI
jgi:hypothetical protein